MTSLTDIFVTVKPDVDKFGPEVKRRLARIDASSEGKKVAGRFGVGFNGAFGGIAKNSAGLFIGAFAAIKSVQVFGGFINDARESAKVARLSAAVIASTGGAAKITAAQMGDLATAVSNKTGADDEAIQSGENLLATFTNIRNQTGAGNDIFNRATAAAVDLAAAMNNGVVDANGLKSANIQLGKALNDPIKGVTALSKVGVSFTAQQKAQIKTLVASGNTLGAQKIILGELGKEFGGAAAAAADPLSRLQTIAGNLAEKVGGFLLPAVDKFATWVGDTAIPKVGAFSDVFVAKVTPALQAFGGFIKDQVLPRLQDFAGFIKDQILPRLADFGGFLKDQVLPRLQEFGKWITGTVIPAVEGFAKKIAESVVPAVQNLVDAFTPLVEKVGTLLVGAFVALLPKIQDLANFLADDVFPKLKDFSGFLKENSDVITGVAAVIAAVLIPHFVALGVAAVISAVKQAGAWVISQAGALGAAVVHSVAVVAMVAGWVLMGVQALINAAKIAAAWLIAMGPVGWVILGITAVIAAVVLLWKKNDGFRNAMIKAWNAVKAALAFVFDWIKANWPLLLAILTGPIGLAVLAIVRNWATIKSTAQTLIDGLKSAFETGIRAIVGFFLGLVQSVITGAAKAFGWVPGLGDKLKTAAKNFNTFRDDTNRALGGIKDQDVKITPIVLAAQQNRRDSVEKRLNRATGGPVFGAGTATSDSIPAMLSNNEHVWTAKEVKAAGGHGAVEQMRHDVLGLAKGGAVGLNLKTAFPPLEGPIDNIARTAVAVAKPLAQTLANKLAATEGPSGPPGSVQRFRGEKLNTRTITMLLNAEKILGAVFNIMQGSYSTRVAASGGTHSGGGAMDTDGPRGWNTAVAALRQVGFAAWHRTPRQGPWGHHIHSIAIGDPTASPSAKRQVADYKRGGDGLGGGMAAGGKVRSLLFDVGSGYLPRGTTVVQNNTGKPEPLTSTDQLLDLGDDTIRALGKEFKKALRQGFTLNSRSGAAYIAQMSNG